MWRVALLSLVVVACSREPRAPAPGPSVPGLEALAIKPKGGAQPPAAGDAPVDVAILLTPGGAWVGASDGDAHFAARCDGGAQDLAAVTAELCRLAQKPKRAGRKDVEVGARDGVAYQEVVSLMDAVIASGHADIGLQEPAALAVRFPDTPSEAQELAPACGQALATCTPVPAPAPPTAAGGGEPPLQKPELAALPVVAVSRAEIFVDGQRIAGLDGVPAGEEWKIVPLYDRMVVARAELERSALPAEERARLRGRVILQADKAVDAGVLKKIMKTLQAAEYPDVMFAVQRAP